MMLMLVKQKVETGWRKVCLVNVSDFSMSQRRLPCWVRSHGSSNSTIVSVWLCWVCLGCLPRCVRLAMCLLNRVIELLFQCISWILSFRGCFTEITHWTDVNLGNPTHPCDAV